MRLLSAIVLAAFLLVPQYISLVSAAARWAGYVTGSSLPDLFPTGTLVTETLTFADSYHRQSGEAATSMAVTASVQIGDMSWALRGITHMRFDCEPDPATFGSGSRSLPLGRFGAVPVLFAGEWPFDWWQPGSIHTICMPRFEASRLEFRRWDMDPLPCSDRELRLRGRDLSIVPEPASLLLLGTGLGGAVPGGAEAAWVAPQSRGCGGIVPLRPAALDALWYRTQ